MKNAHKKMMPTMMLFFAVLSIHVFPARSAADPWEWLKLTPVLDWVAPNLVYWVHVDPRDPVVLSGLSSFAVYHGLSTFKAAWAERGVRKKDRLQKATNDQMIDWFEKAKHRPGSGLPPSDGVTQSLEHANRHLTKCSGGFSLLVTLGVGTSSVMLGSAGYYTAWSLANEKKTTLLALRAKEKAKEVHAPLKQLEKEANAAAETRLDALLKPRVTAFRQALRSNRGALYGNLTHSKVALARGVHSDDNIKEIKSKFVHFDDNGTLDSVLRAVLRKRAIGNSSETTADAWLGELLAKGRERPEYALYLKDCVEDSLIAIFPSLLSKSNLSNYVKEATLKEIVETLDRNWRAKP